MASKKWSSLYRTATRTRLSSWICNHLLRKCRSASNNFSTIGPSGTWTHYNFCTNSYNSSPRQQRRSNNNSSVAAAEFKVMPGASSLSPPSVLMLPTSEVYGIDEEEEEDNYYEGFFCLGGNRIKRLRKTLDLPDEIIYADCKGSSKGWLAFVSREDCRMHLVDLFSPSSLRILRLPSPLSLPRFKEAVAIPEDSSSASSSPVKHILDYGADGIVIERSPGHMSNLLIKRLAISSYELNRDRDFVVMMCPGDGHGLAFYRNGDPAWTPLPGLTQVEDVVYSRKDKLFYSVLTKDGEFRAWDFDNAADDHGFPRMIDFDFGIRYVDFHYPDFFYEQVRNNLHCIKYYLVESPEGEILFLARYSVSIGEDGSFVNANDFPDDLHLRIRTVFFAAFKLDFEKQIVVPVESLLDMALFVGFNESFSLSAHDHPELMANSIYFADDKDHCIYDNCYPYGGDDIGVYNFENYSVTPLYYPFQFKKIRPPPIWVLRPRP